jgi:hypothetical protein
MYFGYGFSEDFAWEDVLLTDLRRKIRPGTR